MANGFPITQQQLEDHLENHGFITNATMEDHLRQADYVTSANMRQWVETALKTDLAEREARLTQSV